ncbi:MAG: hypothetical protein AAF721_13795 [Myxococcota bacterium]
MSELLAHGRDGVDTSATLKLSERVMSPEGVDDPFPDGVPRPRPRAVASLLTLGVGLSAASAAMARVSLKPDCIDRSDVLTCEVPDGADIGVRSGRLFAAVAFGVGGAAFGALGGRALGGLLHDGPAHRRPQRRRIAVGVGTTALVLGVGGLVAGTAVFTSHARQATRLALTFDGTLTPGSADAARLEQTLGHVDTARVGLMALVASPTFIATGVALLVTRPRRRALTLSPTLSRTQMGVSLSGRF